MSQQPLILSEPAFSRAQKRQGIERELRYRRRVFPKRVAEGKMTKKQMDYEIALYEAIAKDYEGDH